MQERFRFVDKHNSGITGHDFCDHARESFDAVARLINYLSGRVESDSVGVNTPLLHVVSWCSIREPDTQLPQIRWVQDKVATESIKYDSPHFVALGVVSKKNVKTALGRTLKITSTLLPHQADATASVKHQR